MTIKQIFLFSILAALTCSLKAQDKYFIKTYGTSKKDMGLQISRTIDNGFFLGGLSFNSDVSGDAIFYKTDSVGTPVWGLNIGVGGALDYPVFVLERSNGECLLGIGCDAANLKFRMVTVNSIGSVLSDSLYYLTEGFPNLVMQGGFLVNDTTIISVDIFQDSCLYARKWSTHGILLDSLILLSSKDFGDNSISLRNMYEYGSQIYINSYIDNSVPTNFVSVLNNDFSVVDSSILSTYIANGYNAVSLSSGNQILAGLGGSFVLLARYSIALDSLIWSTMYPTSSYDISIQCLTTDNTNAFICGQTQLNGEDTIKASILKFDTLGTLLWYKQYTLPSFKRALLTNMQYYSDCLASIGFAYDPNDQNSYEILFVKSDLNGNATSITTFEKPDNTLTVFPNPASDLINVNLLPVGESVFTIVDAGGRELLKGKTQSNQISISSLPAGCYQLLWENDGKKYCAGFVKE